MGRKRILVVDAHRTSLRYYQQILQPEGYDVEISSFQEVQRSKIERLMPGVIILDLLVDYLQEQEAWNLLKTLKAFGATASIPVLICSASFVSQAFFVYIQEQQIPVVFKPFALGELIKQIHLLLASEKN